MTQTQPGERGQVRDERIPGGREADAAQVPVGGADAAVERDRHRDRRRPSRSGSRRRSPCRTPTGHAIGAGDAAAASRARAPCPRRSPRRRSSARLEAERRHRGPTPWCSRCSGTAAPCAAPGGTSSRVAPGRALTSVVAVSGRAGASRSRREPTPPRATASSAPPPPRAQIRNLGHARRCYERRRATRHACFRRAAATNSRSSPGSIENVCSGAGKRRVAHVGGVLADRGHHLRAQLDVLLGEARRAARVDAEQVVQHEHLAVGVGAGADPDHRDLEQRRDRRRRPPPGSPRRRSRTRRPPRARAPARASASARSAVRPCARRPPSAVAVCGVSPTCPITGIPAPTIARTRDSCAGPPPSSLTASARGLLDEPLRGADRLLVGDLVAAEREVGDEQRAARRRAASRRSASASPRRSPRRSSRSRARPRRPSRRRARRRRRPRRRPGRSGSRRR